MAITKDIQKVLLHPTAKLFKEHLKTYIEMQFKEYIKNIRKYRQNSRFYSEFLPIVIIILLIINYFLLIFFNSNFVIS